MAKANVETIKEITDEKRKQLIDKIKKLLSLSNNNSSQEEAISAALTAQKLMAKYNIHEDDVTLEEIKDEIDSVFTHQKHNSHLLSWRKPLAVIVARNFKCKCYMKGQDVVFRGYKDDAEIATEVYSYLYGVGNRLGSKAYNDQLKQTGSGKGAYNSFVMGFVSGVEEGFNVQCTALMIVVPKEVEEEFAQFSANFKKRKPQSISITDAQLYQKGKSEGKEAIKVRSIEKKGGKK